MKYGGVIAFGVGVFGFAIMGLAAYIGGRETFTPSQSLFLFGTMVTFLFWGLSLGMDGVRNK